MTTEAEYQETIAVLRRALMESRAPAPSAWRSMSTAPRDGTPIAVTWRAPMATLETSPAECRGGFWYLLPSVAVASSMLVAWQPLPLPFTGDPADLEASGG